MRTIGLSGAIASGKNLIAKILQKKFDARIFDADAIAHDLLLKDYDTILALKSQFPSSYVESERCKTTSKIAHSSNLAGQINRSALASLILQNQENLAKIEAILHPKIRQKYQEFLIEAETKHCQLVILNIPLLLESSAYKCDGILAIITSKELRKERFVRRALNKAQQDLTESQKIEEIVQMLDQQNFFEAIASWLIYEATDKNKVFKISEDLGTHSKSIKTRMASKFRLHFDKLNNELQLDLEGSSSFEEIDNRKFDEELQAKIQRLETKFEMLNQRQLSSEERIKKADFVLFNE